MKLTGDLVEAFAGTFLSTRYDGACPTPAFHREAWELYTSDCPQAAVAAPRDHAKSTALTVDYVLAETLFRTSSYVIIVGSTEENAGELIGNIADHLIENEDLIDEFGPFTFGTQSKTDIIVRFPDGHRFRVLARGAEQRIRGKMWNGKRPDLIVCDDLEDDEQVENRDRRVKFRKWFFRAAKQALSIQGKIRIHGTILHEDSLLSRLMKNKTWSHLFYKAHRSYADFSDILWPTRWSEAKLRLRQAEFIEDQDPSGYAQEFLNDPMDSADAYLRKEDFLPMGPDDFDKPMVVCVGSDFAVSTADRANRTSFTIGGKCQDNILYVLDERVGRWDSLEWMEEMFLIQARWDPAVFFVEDGVIWKGIAKTVYREMTIRDRFINIVPRTPVKDKGVRGRSLQRRMRAGACRFDKDGSWYSGLENECLRFTGSAAATLDDQFDSLALLSLGFEDLAHLDKDDFKPEEEEQMEREDPRKTAGRSAVTGY
jgi:hypothetical protein